MNSNYNNYMNQNGSCKECPPTYKECKPIESCSKQVINQYHITKQPYIHTFVTEVVHHHVLQNEFIPRYTCYETHVNDPTVNTNSQTVNTNGQ